MKEQLLETLLSHPEMVLPITKSYIEKYKPLVYGLGNEVLEVYKDFANNKEYFDTVAKSRFNQYTAYQEVGFTKEEAMSLLLSDINKRAMLMEEVKKTNKSSTKTSK